MKLDDRPALERLGNPLPHTIVQEALDKASDRVWDDVDTGAAGDSLNELVGWVRDVVADDEERANEFESLLCDHLGTMACTIQDKAIHHLNEMADELEARL